MRRLTTTFTIIATINAGNNSYIAKTPPNPDITMISKLKKEGFNVTVIPNWGYQSYNRMHDKFCIIDMDYVMHGSYNWTATANHNEETLATALDYDLVTKFAMQFMELYTQ